MKKILTVALAFLMGLTIDAFWFPAAHAEAPQPEQSAGQLQPVVVTAERRREDPQRIGASIIAISSRQLDAARVTRPIDLMQLTPGLSTLNETSGGTPVFAVRGIGLDDYNPKNSSGTAVYVDNIYESSPMLLNGQMFDVERVEVLLGPQATLYGRNATGGAINVISRVPTGVPEGYVTGGIGRWDAATLNAAVSGPLGAGWSARLAAAIENQSHGWQEDIDTGRRYGRLNRQAVRGLLQYKSESGFKALLNLHAVHDTSLPLVPQSYNNQVGAGSTGGAFLDTGTSDPTKVKVGNLNLLREEVGNGVGLTLTYDFDAAQLLFIGGWDQYRRQVNDDLDGTPGPTYYFLQNDQMKQAYGELRLVSRRPILSGKTDWTLGISYAGTHFDGNDASDQSAPFVGAYLTPPDYTVLGLSVAQAHYIQTAKSWGAYLQTTTRVLPDLRVIVGGRYSQDRNGFHGATTENGSADGGVLFQGVGSVVASLDQEHRQSNVSYTLGVDYDLTDAIMLYVSGSSAYKAGTYYAGPALDPAAWRYVRPERVQGFETGFKSRWLENRLLLNFAAFTYHYTDRQSIIIFVSPATGLPVGSLANVPKSRINGGELQLSAKPIDALTVSIGFSYLDAYVTETLHDVGGAPLYSPVPVGTGLAQAPNTSYLASAAYNFPAVSDWRPTLTVDGRWTARQTTSISDPNGSYGPMELVNARLAFQSLNEQWTLAAWSRNLTNSRAITYAGSDFWGGVTAYRQQPISYGVEVTRQF